MQTVTFHTIGVTSKLKEHIDTQYI